MSAEVKRAAVIETHNGFFICHELRRSGAEETYILRIDPAEGPSGVLWVTKPAAQLIATQLTAFLSKE